MAEVRLGKYELGAGRLPKICIRCGKASSVEKAKEFHWYPEWVSAVLVFGPMAALFVNGMSKRMTITAPLCYDHRRHWLGRSLVSYLSFLALVFLGIGVLAWASSTQGQRAGDDPWLGAVCIGFTVTFLAWIIMAAILQGTAIRAKEIADNSITLKGVSDMFVAALKDSRKNTREIDAKTPPLTLLQPPMDIEEVELDEED